MGIAAWVKEGLGDVAWKEGIVVCQQLFACRVIFGDGCAVMEFVFFFLTVCRKAGLQLTPPSLAALHWLRKGVKAVLWRILIQLVSSSSLVPKGSSIKST